MANWITAIAACVYTLIALVGAIYVYRQLKTLQEASSLEAFKTFYELWEDVQLRAARRSIYSRFGPLLRLKDESKQIEELRKSMANLNEEERANIDLVIYRSNLVGLLWSEKFFSSEMRDRVIGYIYKTAIVTWDCLYPYIQFVRQQRSELPGSITYAAPFEHLVKDAEKKLGERPRPQPSQF